MKGLITKTRRRKIAAGVLSTLTVAAVAMAYFLATYTFEGSGSAKLGSKSATPVKETMAVSFAEGLTPNTHEALTVSADPSSEVVLEPGATLAVTFTTPAEPACAAFLAVTESGSTGKEKEETEAYKLLHGTEGAVTFPAGKSTSISGLMIELKESGESESKCEGVSVTAKAVLTGPGH
jgi:hypothetical protein